jgi:hypothetical protein
MIDAGGRGGVRSLLLAYCDISAFLSAMEKRGQALLP